MNIIMTNLNGDVFRFINVETVEKDDGYYIITHNGMETKLNVGLITNFIIER